jgi:hypothetical protein
LLRMNRQPSSVMAANVLFLAPRDV